MKLVPVDIHSCKFSVGDLDTLGIMILIELGMHFEPCLGRRRANQLDDRQK